MNRRRLTSWGTGRAAQRQDLDAGVSAGRLDDAPGLHSADGVPLTVAAIASEEQRIVVGELLLARLQ